MNTIFHSSHSYRRHDPIVPADVFGAIACFALIAMLGLAGVFAMSIDPTVAPAALAESAIGAY